MIWLTWRQHRTQAAAAAAVIALLAAFLLVTEHQMTGYLSSTGLSACMARHGSCDSLSQSFENRFGTLLNDIAYFNFLPLLAGMFWGAPLLAREFEQGTHVLAWTQTVSRRRWLTVKLSAFILGAVAASVALSLLFGWWFQPFGDLAVHGGQSRIQPTNFDLQGVVPIGYTVFAFALGTTAGALIRRTAPAMGVTVAGFVVARLGIEALRGHFFAPLHASHSLARPDGSISVGSPLVSPQNWVTNSDTVDRAGHTVTNADVLQTCGGVGGSRIARCITQHGYRQIDHYQPLTRYWALQWIELSIFLILAITLLIVASRTVIRRP